MLSAGDKTRVCTEPEEESPYPHMETSFLGALKLGAFLLSNCLSFREILLVYDAERILKSKV